MKTEKQETNKKRVVCAMSGGVDSSVAAALLKKQGYDVIGIFMKFWTEENVAKTDLVRENICCSVDAATAARAVAQKLDIPFYVVNFEKEFKKMVVDYYIKEYENGRTPNPCVICNRDIKGELLLQKANELGADYLATGHYARIVNDNSRILNFKFLISKDKNLVYHLYQPKDKVKDQTYFLWTLTQEKLTHILFPCGNYTKPEIREMAVKWNLPTAQRRESQGICFIPDRDVSGFLMRYAKKLIKPGEIVDTKGEVLGHHEGLVNYTIGQRERLGLGGPKAYYVVKLDSKENKLIVGDEEDLYRKELTVENLNWINTKFKNPNLKFKVGARIRHGHPIVACQVETLENNETKVIFDKPQRAVTPGQSIVLYDEEEVIGGGIIK